MKLTTRLKIFKWKIIAGVAILVLLILALVTFGVYFKVKGLSSFLIQERQADIAASQSQQIESMSGSLEGMEDALGGLNAELREIRHELCLERDRTGESCEDEEEAAE